MKEVIRMPEKLAEIRKIYQEKRDSFVKYSEYIRERINYLLMINNIVPAKLEIRVKEVQSFINKIEKKNNKYKNPIFEMTDIIGVRIVTYYNTEIDEVIRLLKENFHIDYENSADKENGLEFDRMGYLSVHYVCQLKNHMHVHEKIKMEIQVRSLLQHTWAAIDHKLRYKTLVEIPKDIKRKLFRLSALLEVADSEFAHIKHEIEMMEKFYVNKFEEKKYNVRIELSALNYYLKYNDDRILEIAKKYDIANFKPFDVAKEEKLEKKLYHFLLKVNKHYISDLDTMINFVDEKSDDIIDALGDEILQKLSFLVNSSCTFIMAFLILGYLDIGRAKKIYNFDDANLIRVLQLRENIWGQKEVRDLVKTENKFKK